MGDRTLRSAALDAFRCQSAAAHRSHSIHDLNTSELRWFSPGRPPQAIVEWFSNGGNSGTWEERRDVYQFYGLSEVGVKRRSGRALEIKVRTAVGPVIIVAEGLEAPLEDWRKWTPSSGDPVWLQSHARWLPVDKTLLTRTFTMEGGEVVGPASHVGAHRGCDIELATVTVGAIEAWTFAFEVFGPRRRRREELLSSWEKLLADAGPFEGLGPYLEHTAGYPEWLRSVAPRPAEIEHGDQLAD